MSKFELMPPPNAETRKALGEYSDFLVSLLHNRNIETAKAAEAFLNPSYENHMHDPFLLHQMDVAVWRILQAIKANEKIIIYSDYDCDGIPGAVVLHDFFKAISFSNFYNHIPHRHFDGFGLTEKAVLKLKGEQDPQLLITIDCGTTNIEAVALAKKNNIDVIITDHHEPKVKLPEAVAVVNPKVGDTYPFNGLCGSGVIFKLIQALILKGDFKLSPGQEKWWLDMVGLATIADLVPLTGENRVLAYFGLKVLRKSRRPGIYQLLKKQGVNQALVSEDDIGFTIGPRINAASRMDTPEDAFHLLSTTDETEAKTRLTHLEKLNTERKSAVAQITKEVHVRIKAKEAIPSVIVLGNPDWRPSLVGLAAGKLADEQKRPTFLWGRDGNGIIKGSCRSGGGVSVLKLMNEIPEFFSEFGGHHAAGGFSVAEDKIHKLPTGLENAFVKLGEAAVVSDPHLVDMELLLDEISTEHLKAQNRCAPYGVDNRKPLYLIKNALVKEVVPFGKAKEHTKLIFKTTGSAKEAVAFFKKPEDFALTTDENQTLSVLAHLEESFFMGRRQTRLRLVAVV